MSATAQSPEPSIPLFLQWLRQLIGMVEGWDMGNSPEPRQPLPPLEVYLAQHGALDSQGNRIDSPETQELISYWFKLDEADAKRRQVQKTGTDPDEVFGFFDNACSNLGGVAEALEWPRPVSVQYLDLGGGVSSFDPRKPLPSGSQFPRFCDLVVVPPPPSDQPLQLPFILELWLPKPRQDARFEVGMSYKVTAKGIWPPPPQAPTPTGNERLRSWDMHNDRGKPQLLEALRMWERFAEGKVKTPMPAETLTEKEEDLLGPVERAIAMKINNPTLSLRKIAKAVGMTPPTLSRREAWRNAISRLDKVNKGNVRRGRKTASGDIEAEADQEDADE